MGSQRVRHDWATNTFTLYIYIYIVCGTSCPCSVAHLCLTLCDSVDYSPPGSSVNPMDRWLTPRKNTGVSCHFLLQGMFPAQGSNLCLMQLLHWQMDSLPLSHLGSCVVHIGAKLMLADTFGMLMFFPSPNPHLWMNTSNLFHGAHFKPHLSHEVSLWVCNGSKPFPPAMYVHLPALFPSPGARLAFCIVMSSPA